MARAMLPPRPPRVPEKAVQSQVVTLLRSIGASVYTLGTTRRRGDHQGTMQSLGLPDLYAFLPRRGVGAPPAVWIELKAVDGQLRPEQIAFRDLCHAAYGVEHIVGGVDDVIAFLVRAGYLKAENVPHYRQPKGLSDGQAETEKGHVHPDRA